MAVAVQDQAEMLDLAGTLFNNSGTAVVALGANGTTTVAIACPTGKELFGKYALLSQTAATAVVYRVWDGPAGTANGGTLLDVIVLGATPCFELDLMRYKITPGNAITLEAQATGG